MWWVLKKHATDIGGIFKTFSKSREKFERKFLETYKKYRENLKKIGKYEGCRKSKLSSISTKEHSNKMK